MLLNALLCYKSVRVRQSHALKHEEREGARTLTPINKDVIDVNCLNVAGQQNTPVGLRLFTISVCSSCCVTPSGSLMCVCCSVFDLRSTVSIIESVSLSH